MSLTALETPARLDRLREVFRLLNKHDANLLLPYWHPDIVEEFPTGTVRGREAVRDYFAATFAAIPDFHIEVRHMAAEGDVVFVRWQATGHFTGARWMGIDPNGAAITLDGIDCFTMQGDVVVHNFVAYDQVSFGRQIGLLPAAGTIMDRGMLGAFNATTWAKRLLGRKA
jgi:predicted ester cyclase